MHFSLHMCACMWVHAVRVCVVFQNGFWFCLGWCVAFFIPSIVVATVLASLYRTSPTPYLHHPQADGGKDFEDA